MNDTDNIILTHVTDNEDMKHIQRDDDVIDINGDLIFDGEWNNSVLVKSNCISGDWFDGFERYKWTHGEVAVYRVWKHYE